MNMTRIALTALAGLAALLVTNGPGLGNEFPQPAGEDGLRDNFRGRHVEHRQHNIARPVLVVEPLDLSCSFAVTGGMVMVTFVNQGGAIAGGTFIGAVLDGDWTILDLYLPEGLDRGETRTMALADWDPALFAGKGCLSVIKRA
jgi:hypothetical protein